MSLLNMRRGSSEPEMTTMGMQELMDGYNLEHVEDEPGEQFAVVTSKAGSLTGEYGSTSPSPWTAFTRKEYNHKLRGQQGLELYDKMRRSDGNIRSTLRVAKIPVLAARWFIEAGGPRKKDKAIAEWIEENLFEQMSTPWAQTLTECLLMLDFGYYNFEKVWETRVVGGKLRTVLKKLAPRHPMDVKEWRFDANGGPNAAVFYGKGIGMDEDVVIPIEKLLTFTFDKEAGNIEGIPVLRSAYKHWYYKEQLYKIDAIQKERHGIGIPIIKLPVGYSAEDKAAAENLGRNIRTNERAHIVLPPGWDMAMLKLEGNPVDCLTSIAHHDSMIRMNVLADFITTPTGGDSSGLMALFMKATRFIGDIVADTMNSYLIPQMVAYNSPGAAIPKLRVRRIGEQEDQRTVSFAVRNFIGAGAIEPDDKLEEYLREFMDLPMKDEETTRSQQTPQKPDEEGDDKEDEETEDAKKPGAARVGPPRQALTKNQTKVNGKPSKSKGDDNSGG